MSMPEEQVSQNLQQDYLSRRTAMVGASAAEEILSRVRAKRPAAAQDTPAAPAAAPAVAPVEGSAAGRVVKDVGVGIVETPRAIVKGARDAYQSTINMAKELGSWIEDKANLPGLKIDSQGVSVVDSDELKTLDRPGFNLPDIDSPTSVTGSAVKNVAQFLTGMKGVDKLLKLGGVNTANYTAASVKGAVANFTAFDAHQERLSNLIEEVPALKNPVTAFLAANPDDNAAEGRFKNALEGAGLGIAADGMLKAVKLLRNVDTTKTAVQLLDDAATKTPEIQPDAFKALGDETKEAGDTFLQSRPPDIDPANLGKSTEEPQTFINFARIESSDDVKRVMQEVADANKPEVDAARRGKQSFEKIKLNAEEQNAWNILKSRRVGEGLNAEQSVAARQLWASSAKKLTEVAEIANTAPTEANLFAFRKMLTVHDAIQKEVIGARTETARALASWRIPVGDGAERLRDIAGILGENGGVEATKELAQRVSSLARAGMTSELTSVVEKTAYAKTRDAMVEGWINGLLSNPGTHVINSLSNTVVLAMRVAERNVGAKISSLLGDEDAVAMGEATMQWHGMVNGVRDAFSYAAKTARTGESGFGLGKIETPRQPAISSQAFNLPSTGFLGRSMDYLGGFVRLPGRALSAADEFFKTLGYRMEIHAQALRQGQQDVFAGKITQDELGKHMADIVRNPPEDIRMAAVDAATYQTFTNTPGKLAQSISGLTQEYPALKLILPFTKTPANILNFTFERTPLAPLMKGFRANVAAGGARRDLALAQIGLGTSIMLASADAAMNGQITGRGPAETGERQAMSRTGWQPYSVKIGDRWVAYNRLDPMGSLLGMAADTVEALQNAQHEALDDADTEKLAVATTLAIASNLTNKTYLSGLSDLFEAMSNPQQYGEGMIQRLAGSIVPAGVAGANRISDPYMHEVSSMLDAIKARTPGLSADLPKRVNLWGEPQKYESGFGKAYDFMVPIYTKPPNDEPIDKEILAQQFNITMPPKNTQFNGVGVDLTQYPGAYTRYVELAGNKAKHPAWDVGAKDLLNEIVTGKHPLSDVYELRSDGPDGGKDVFVRDILRQYRDIAKDQLLEEYPDLARDVGVKVEHRREIKAPKL